MMEKNSLVYVANSDGFIGSAIVKELKKQGYENLLLKSSSELDLLNQRAVEIFFENSKPEYVFLPSFRTRSISFSILTCRKRDLHVK